MITSCTLGGNLLTTNQILMTDFNNASFPATVYTRSKRGGYQGSKLVTPTFSSYQFVANFVIVGNSFADLVVQRKAFMGILGLVHSAGVQTLIVNRSDGTSIQIDIKAVSVVGDYSADDTTSCKVQVTLEAEYPFFMGTTPYSVDVQIENGGGFGVPFGLPFAMNINQSNVVSLSNNGNYAAYPIFTFSGALTTPSIINNLTGETLGVNYTLTDTTKKVIVDCYNRTALFQDGNNARQYITGTFWSVPSNGCTVTLGNSNGTDGGKCNIAYRDTFLNL